MKRLAKRVLLVGWDAADWKVIHPLLDAGKMPGLQSLVEDGVMANLATLHPVLSPTLWTSIATGKRPFKHGILGFSEPTPDGTAIQPITNLARKTKAIWNILTQKGLRSHVVGWWPSHPAEPIDGVMVSNNYQQAIGPIDKPWPMRRGTVHPDRLAEELAELRVHPNELNGEHVLPFIPRVAEINQDQDGRAAAVLRIIAECSSVHSVATHLMAEESWDFAAIYYDAIDHFSHVAMKYHPPRRKHIRKHDFELYKDVVTAGYLYHDMMLRTLLDLAGDDTTVILMSDHGFHPDHMRPRELPAEPAGPAIEHRDLGIFAMKGPGIEKDIHVHGANLLDITPTILTLFGLPVGQDMDGKPLLQAFSEPPAIESIPSWDDVPGRDGRHPPDFKVDPFESKQALDQLVALGYIERPNENREVAIANTLSELNYNLARSYMDAGQFAEAAPLLAELYAAAPSEYRYGINLAMCYRNLDCFVEMDQLVSDMNERRKEDARNARGELKKILKIARARRAERLAEREAEKQAAQAASEGDAANEEEETSSVQKKNGKGPRKPLFSSTEHQQIRKLRGLAKINSFSLDFLSGYVDLATGDSKSALKKLRKAEDANRERPGLHIQIGEAYLKLNKWDDAARGFRKAARIDSENPHVHMGLCRAYLGMRKNKRAVDEALQTIGLLYQYPMAHYNLGIGLHRMRQYDRAIEALELAISLNPNFAEAHKRLAKIYQRHYGDGEKAEEHRRLAREIRDDRRTRRESRPAPPLPRFTGPLEAVEFKERSSGQDQPPGQRIPRLGHGPVSAEHLMKAEWNAPITIVSGLPRSGTSMMMQMLQAGGLLPLTDDVRTADEDNPRGYLEFEKAKQLRTDVEWLPDAQSRVVKVVVQLLPFLPQGPDYRVIFMQRNLDEVVASQTELLKRQQQQGADLSDQRLKRVFSGQVQQVGRVIGLHKISVLRVPYAEAISDPVAVARQAATFLGGDMDIEAMAEAVDSDLYRQRRSTDAVT